MRRELIKQKMDEAIDKYKYDAGFTPPELQEERIIQLRARLHDIADQVGE